MHYSRIRTIFGSIFCATKEKNRKNLTFKGFLTAWLETNLVNNWPDHKNLDNYGRPQLADHFTTSNAFFQFPLSITKVANPDTMQIVLRRSI